MKGCACAEEYGEDVCKRLCVWYILASDPVSISIPTFIQSQNENRNWV